MAIDLRRVEIDNQGATIDLLVLPLLAGDDRIGAIVLLQNVTELRRRDRELVTKDTTIREIHHRSRPHHHADAAAARHQRAEPAVQPPHPLPPLPVHPPPPQKHGPARPSAGAKRSNLRGKSVTSHVQCTPKAQASGGSASHRHAAAGVSGDEQRLQRPVVGRVAGIGPERHAA